MSVAAAPSSSTVAPAPVAAAGARVQAIDWMRGLVMVLMTIDHVGATLDKHHMHGDTAHNWVRGSPLPPGEFLTRWITHLCAPTFVLLAGAAMALSIEKRGDRPGQTAFLVKRGLLIAALDPLWMSLGFVGYDFWVFQVLYAIGLSMVAMAFLRRLPSWALLAGGLVIQLGGEWAGGLFPPRWSVANSMGVLLFNSGPFTRTIHTYCAYPLLPWLSLMMFGWVLGRWVLATRTRSTGWRAARLAGLGVALLGVFAIVRGLDGYGNWGLHRDSMDVLQWLHVAKYPPSLSYCALELGLAFVLLAAFVAVDDGQPRPWLRPLAVLGATAFFYYLIHVHLVYFVQHAFHLDTESAGLTKTWLGTLLLLLLLYPLCVRYRRYKAAHPDGWTRYI
jgi:uncharacterized membrane protein